jgi:hypothetical protein
LPARPPPRWRIALLGTSCVRASAPSTSGHVLRPESSCAVCARVDEATCHRHAAGRKRSHASIAMNASRLLAGTWAPGTGPGTSQAQLASGRSAGLRPLSGRAPASPLLPHAPGPAMTFMRSMDTCVTAVTRARTQALPKTSMNISNAHPQGRGRAHTSAPSSVRCSKATSYLLNTVLALRAG